MNEAAKAHGLDGTLVEPDWPPLTLSEVRILRDHFPSVSAPVAILSASPRPFSAASIVETLHNRVFIKRHARAVRDASGLVEEHQFMAHLRANGIAVPRVFETDSGSTAAEIGDCTYEVHEIPTGIDLYEDAISWTPFMSPRHARSAGEMLARLHIAAGAYDAPPRMQRPLITSFTIFANPEPADALEAYLAARPALSADTPTRDDCKRALDLLAPFQSELKPLLPSLAPLWSHNDLHASNLFWSDTGPHAHATSVIDFGLSDRTNAIHDLAQAIERNIVGWLTLMNDPEFGDQVPVHLDHLWALLDGYESVKPLAREEAAALAPMLALSHAEFALTEAHYFLGILHSPDKARVATHDYLVGHAKWFHGAGTKKLLNPLRRWAQGRESRVTLA